MTWKHDDLAADLARAMRTDGRWLTFMNVEMADCDGGPQRSAYPDYPLRRGLSHEESKREWEEYKAAVHAWRSENPTGGLPDVFAIPNTSNAQSMRPRVYEIKVSRSDFQKDVRSEKWRRYLYVAGQIVFAVPDGLVQPDEVPKGCGLIVRGETHWTVRKNARRFHDGRLSFNQAFRLVRACHSQLAGDHWRKGAAV